MIKFIIESTTGLIPTIKGRSTHSSWFSHRKVIGITEKRCLTIDRSRPLEIYLAKLPLEDLSFFSFSPFFIRREVEERFKKVPLRKIKDRSRGLPGKINLLLFKFHLDEVPSLSLWPPGNEATTNQSINNINRIIIKIFPRP